MRVLVTAASRHGGTVEVAHAIAMALEQADITVDERRPEAVGHLNAYDGVVLGSAIYAGHWLKAATELVERTSSRMRTLPVWLFSTGPIGDPLKPEGSPPDITTISEQSGARDHRIFGGRLDKGQLGLGEKVLVRMVGATEGDYRQWDEINAWAMEIAASLKAGELLARAS
ncbi:MAG: menaquinone-dependent protoporphyrinogen oxidase [Chloroflexota bacterium]|nr:menaquinone-dependent protoporphyrinogen oxidase [Chloroflexota bacterium]